MTTGNDPRRAPTRSWSRRTALHGGGVLLAALGSCSLARSAAAQATPTAMAPGGALLAVQSFSQGTLFPTQGDAGVLPYTVILWGAADRGFFFTDAASGAAGVVSTASVLSAIDAGGEQPRAVLVAPTAAASYGVWALRLGYGELGSDPGAVTYQGEPLPGEEAAAWLGMTPPDLPASPLDLTAGYLIIAGLSGFAAAGSDGVRLNPR